MKCEICGRSENVVKRSKPLPGAEIGWLPEIICSTCFGGMIQWRIRLERFGSSGFISINPRLHFNQPKSMDFNQPKSMDETLKLKELLREAAVAIVMLENGACACESETGYEPEFICGYHRILSKIDDVLSDQPKVE